MKQTIRNKRKRRLARMQGLDEEKRSEGLKRIFLLLILLIFLGVCIGVAAFIITPHTEMVTLREELEAKKAQVERAKEREQQARQHLKWMEDPEYAEQIARDSANQAHVSETIIHIEPAETDKPEPEPKPAAER